MTICKSLCTPLCPIHTGCEAVSTPSLIAFLFSAINKSFCLQLWKLLVCGLLLAKSVGVTFADVPHLMGLRLEAYFQVAGGSGHALWESHAVVKLVHLCWLAWLPQWAEESTVICIHHWHTFLLEGHVTSVERRGFLLVYLF